MFPKYSRRLSRGMRPNYDIAMLSFVPQPNLHLAFINQKLFQNR